MQHFVMDFFFSLLDIRVFVVCLAHVESCLITKYFSPIEISFLFTCIVLFTVLYTYSCSSLINAKVTKWEIENAKKKNEKNSHLIPYICNVRTAYFHLMRFCMYNKYLSTLQVLYHAIYLVTKIVQPSFFVQYKRKKNKK